MHICGVRSIKVCSDVQWISEHLSTEARLYSECRIMLLVDRVASESTVVGVELIVGSSGWLSRTF